MDKRTNLATAKQVQLIKMGQRNLSIPDAVYRARLKSVYGKTSCTQLTVGEASDYIGYLAAQGGLDGSMLGSNTTRWSPGKYSQEDYIKLLWKKTGKTPAQLSSFCLAVTGKGDIDRCSKAEKSAIIDKLKEDLDKSK